MDKDDTCVFLWDKDCDVYVDKDENSSKNNKIPNENTVKKLEKRNENLFKLMKDKFPKDKPTYELGLSIKLKLVRKYWIKSKWEKNLNYFIKLWV